MKVKTVLLAILILVLLTALGWGIWFFGVATSNTYGRGQQQKQINDSTNRTFQYQHFFDLDASIRSYTQQLRHEAASPSGDKAYHNSVMNGLYNQCIAAVNQYNADAQEFTRARFLDAKLPAHEGDDTATNCLTSGEGNP